MRALCRHTAPDRHRLFDDAPLISQLRVGQLSHSVFHMLGSNERLLDRAHKQRRPPGFPRRPYERSFLNDSTTAYDLPSAREAKQSAKPRKFPRFLPLPTAHVRATVIGCCR